MGRGYIAIGALVLLSACGGSPTVSETNVAVTSDANMVVPMGNEGDGNAALGNESEVRPAFGLAADGVTVGAQSIVFSTNREASVAAVQSALGAPTEQGTNPECGAGPLDNVDFAGGVTLFLQDGKFVGWSIDGRNGSPYKTAKGLGIGSTLEQLRAAGDVMVQATSLGNEFTAGEISGLLTTDMPDGKVTNIWAGTTCAFR
jgi:hypothetical protein